MPESGVSEITAYLVPDRYLARHGANEKLIKKRQDSNGELLSRLFAAATFLRCGLQKSRQQLAEEKGKDGKHF